MKLPLSGAILGLGLLLLMPALARAEIVSLGPPITDSLTVTAAPEIDGFDTIALSGGAGYSGASGYSIGGENEFFIAGPGGPWVSIGNPNGYLNSWVNAFGYANAVEVEDCCELTQTGSGAIFFTFDIEGYVIVFKMTDDPTALSSLVYTSGTPVLGTNYVDLTVLGGCYEASSSCESTLSQGSPTPEPATGVFMLTGIGLMLVVRKRRAQARSVRPQGARPATIITDQ